MSPDRTIRVDEIARVEGEGSLELCLQAGRVESVRLSIFEPPRFFEALLRGRDYTEAPDITARICGICPVAYQMGAVHAMERAIGVRVDGQLRSLRRLLYCGEWIGSHALHIGLLHAPDFLGYPDAMQMAREHGEQVNAALALRQVGNRILRVLGGRDIHPINVRVGGFYRLPDPTELAALTAPLAQAQQQAHQLLEWAAAFRFPDFERDYEFVALRHGQEYPLNEGRIVSSRGLDIDVAQFDSEFEERQVAHSNALQARIRRRGSYLVGPLARYALNFDCLPADVQAAARQVGLPPVCRNPYRSILIRAIEVLYACGEALRLIRAYAAPEAAAVPVVPRAGSGEACTEAPRGICHHRYQIDQSGAILAARIVPPTSQNQLSIEEDLREVAGANATLADELLRERCEQAIRNYDPCISCSTHFLKLQVRR
jgi:coenzyme F420-reducing hydrogenase alpha subunit